MKSSLVVAAALAVSAAITSAQVRDATTHQELEAKQRKMAQNHPMKQGVPEGTKDPSKVKVTAGFIESSDFLSFQGISTLIPKGAIMTMPKNYQNRMRHVSGSKLVAWPDFYPLNRGWIKTVELTLEQATGQEKLPEEMLERIKSSSIVVVATFKGGPVSVIPPKEEPAEGEAQN